MSGAAVFTFLSELWNFIVALVQSRPGRLEETRKWHKTCWSSAVRSWLSVHAADWVHLSYWLTLCRPTHLWNNTSHPTNLSLNLENRTLAVSTLILQQQQYEQYYYYSSIAGLHLSILEVATGQWRAWPTGQSRLQETSGDKTETHTDIIHWCSIWWRRKNATKHIR